MGEVPHRFNFLKRAACADAKHDFGDKKINLARTPSDRPGFPEILKGLDSSSHREIPNPIDSEDAVIQVLTAQGIPALKANLKRSPEKTATIPINGYDTRPYEYKVKLLHKGAIYDTDKMKGANSLTLHDMATFFESKDLNLVIDASSLGIMKLISGLKRDPAHDTEFSINLLVNRETVNDPAGKLTEFCKITEAVNEKLRTDVLIDREPYEIQYVRNTPGLEPVELQRDKFFSVLDFKMSPVHYQQNQHGSMKSKYVSINVDILQNDGKRVYYTNDPKLCNTIDSCWNLMLKAFRQNENANRLEIAAYFQCKRSGDWLQALSCLDRGRMYGNSKGIIKSIKGDITLVTHDRILLAYALFIGVDVIYTSYTPAEKEHALIYFRNESSPNRQTPEERKALILKETSDYVEATLEADKAYMVEYNGWVQQILAKCGDNINSALQKSNGTYSNDYFVELWKIITLDYHDFTELQDSIEKDMSKYQVDPNDISVCERILSFKAILGQKKSASPTIQSIYQSNNSFKRDANYASIVSPTAILREQRGRADPENNLKTKAISMVDAFSTRLPEGRFQEFRQTCIRWAREKAGEEKLIIHLIAKLLEEEYGGDDIDVMTDLTNILKPEAPVALEDAPGGPVPPGAPEMDEAPPPVAEADVEEDKTTREDEAVAEQGELTNVSAKRKVVKSLFGFGEVLGNLASRVLNYLRVQRGGAKIYGINEEDNTSLRYSFLVNTYLRTLYSNFNELDSESNFDYEYYEKLILIIREIFSRVQSAEERAYVLYTMLPNQNYDLIPYVAKQIGLQSLGMWAQEIPQLEGNVPFSLEGFEGHLEDFRRGSFEKRKAELVKYVLGEFEEIVLNFEPVKPKSSKVSGKKSGSKARSRSRSSKASMEVSAEKVLETPSRSMEVSGEPVLETPPRSMEVSEPEQKSKVKKRVPVFKLKTSVKEKTQKKSQKDSFSKGVTRKRKRSLESEGLDQILL